MTLTTPLTEGELLERAQSIAGLTFAEVAGPLGWPVPETLHQAKGWVGELMETCLGASASSLPEPDFQAIGVELKTIPVDRNGRPKESTYVCAVPLTGNLDLTWETSVVRQKLARVLWVPVEADPRIPVPERRIGSPLLWSPGPTEEAALRADWEELMELVIMGELDQLTGELGTYLQIRPKAPNARALRESTSETGEKALTLPRGFYLRTSFTTEILNRHYLRRG
ncbi:MAG: DNA mismatch repair endonuclease MutH [Gammaproteobacteria bacterium]|nr:DNA mismatch repair endonuclease MutH [Gammaproteobacteria bacterium]